MAKTVITPWEVRGDIDYEKVMKEFGVSPLGSGLQTELEKHTGPLHQFIKRKIFFAHRDLDLVLKEHKKGNDFFLYTGRGPSGQIHLGHIIPLLMTKWLQEKFDVDVWLQLTDDEKFLFKPGLSLEEANRLAHENAIDMIALGFNPKKTKIIIDSEAAGPLYKEAIKVAKKITFSTTKAVFGFRNDTNIGSIFFTAMQAVPAFLPSILAGKKMMCLIPHAIDQDPHFRVSRDIMPKLGYPKPASIQCRFLPGLGGMQGDGKMSSSETHTAVYLSDDPKTIEKKIRKYAFSGGRETVEAHRKHGGNPDVDVAYQWLTFFEEDDRKLERIRHDYKSGALLSGELKGILIEKLQRFIANHQKQRAKAAKIKDKVLFRG